MPAWKQCKRPACYTALIGSHIIGNILNDFGWPSMYEVKVTESKQKMQRLPISQKQTTRECVYWAALLRPWPMTRIPSTTRPCLHAHGRFRRNQLWTRANDWNQVHKNLAQFVSVSRLQHLAKCLESSVDTLHPTSFIAIGYLTSCLTFTVARHIACSAVQTQQQITAIAR